MGRIVTDNNCPENSNGHCFAFGCKCTHKTKELCHKAVMARNAKVGKGYCQLAFNRRWVRQEDVSINGRITIKTFVDGKEKSVNELSNMLGLPTQEVLARIDKALMALNPVPKPYDKFQRKLKI